MSALCAYASVPPLGLQDNRCTMHLATGSEQPRTLYRTMVTGTAPC